MARIDENKVKENKAKDKIDIGIWRKLFKYLSEFKNGLIFLAFLNGGGSRYRCSNATSNKVCH